MTEKTKTKEKVSDKIAEEIKEEVKEEIKEEIPKSPETKTEEKKEEAAEKVAEEVKEQTEKVAEKVAEKETPKEPEKPKKKKHEAVANGSALPISKKQAMYICKFIKNKSPDQAIVELTQVINLKKPIPFKGEIPHRKGKIQSGRYPVKACKYFINLLKALKGNSIVNGLELENTRISESSATWAARPMRRGGRSAKRTNVILKAREIKPKKEEKK